MFEAPAMSAATASTPEQREDSTGRRRARQWLAGIPVLVPLVILLATGIRGLDFGFHWDERTYQVEPVKQMIRTGILLPGHYGYPSLTYWVGATAVLPDAHILLAGSRRLERLFAVMDGRDYLLRLRCLYLLIGSLSLVWTYLLVLRWRSSRTEAFLAASFLGLSWEVAYHLRWVATDTLLMHFGVLTVMFAMWYWLEPHRRYLLYLAAIAAGLSCGAKYPGALLVIPVLIAAGRTLDGWRADRRVLLRVIAIFALTYLVTTPGTLLQPGKFVGDVLYEMRHYAGGHGGHSVAPGWEHGTRMLIYFASAAFSTVTPLAIAAFALVLIGAYALLRDRLAIALLFLSFPLTYFVYFTAQSTMIARNLLVLAPFGAILAARGTLWLWNRRGGARLTRPIVAVVVGAILLVNAAWLVRAAQSVATRDDHRFVREAAAWIGSERAHSVWISPRLRTQFRASGLSLPPNVVDDASRAEKLVLYSAEGMPSHRDWPANRPRLTERWFGPYEVNFNMYPEWWGEERIVVLSHATARQIELLPLAGERFTASLPADLSAIPEGRPHPCALVPAEDIAREVGLILHGPLGASAVNGVGCIYVAENAIVTLGTLRTSVPAFTAQRAELRGVNPLEEVGDSAYWRESGPGEATLFVKQGETAFMVRVTNASEDAPIGRAVRIARVALVRLGSNS